MPEYRWLTPNTRECKQCGGGSEPGADVFPYWVPEGPQGEGLHVWLHQACSGPWHERYRRWRHRRRQEDSNGY